MKAEERLVIRPAHIQQLIDSLIRRGYRVKGPVVRNEAVVYDDLSSLEDLPIGWTDEQGGGRYRLRRRDDEALFGYSLGPRTWKVFLHPPERRLWKAERNGRGFRIIEEEERPPLFAFIGVRPCELHAISILDRVLAGGEFVDPSYRARREGLFVVVANCGEAGGTCFCSSMDTGPAAASGFDIALTEVVTAEDHYLLAEAGTGKGAEVLGETGGVRPGEAEITAARKTVEEAAARMGRSMTGSDLKDLLYRSYEHPRWDDVARRCLTCGNCTMVCPTCFCTTVEDRTEITGGTAERWQRADSCFSAEFSYIHGGSIRSSPKARYRHWIMHKLAAWVDQFGRSGCVGCGRCITWCPVGIDITEEVGAIRKNGVRGSDREGEG